MAFFNADPRNSMNARFTTCLELEPYRSSYGPLPFAIQVDCELKSMKVICTLANQSHSPVQHPRKDVAWV